MTVTVTNSEADLVTFKINYDGSVKKDTKTVEARL